MDLLSLHLVNLRHDFFLRRSLYVVGLVVRFASIIALFYFTISNFAVAKSLSYS